MTDNRLPSDKHLPAEKVEQAVPTFVEIKQFWAGYVTGTNRGLFWMRIRQRGETVKGTLILRDVMFASTVASLVGSRKGNHAQLEMQNIRCIAPSVPVTGRVELDFNDSTQSATGAWQTDLGTAGNFSASVTTISEIAWASRLGATLLGLMARRFTPALYVAMLIALPLLDSLSLIHLSYPGLILILIPAPHFLRTYITELMFIVREARVKKFGPVEFDQPPLPEEIRQMVNREAQRASAFVYLDFFFIPRTKVLLIWIADKRSVTRAEFDTQAAAVGVPANNVDVTLQALFLGGCIVAQEQKIVISPWGEEYVAHLVAQANAAR